MSFVFLTCIYFGLLNNGYWTQHSRQRRPIPRSPDEFPGLATVINTCQLWEADGPLMRMLREALEKKRKEKNNDNPVKKGIS